MHTATETPAPSEHPAARPRASATAAVESSKRAEWDLHFEDGKGNAIRTLCARCGGHINPITGKTQSAQRLSSTQPTATIKVVGDQPHSSQAKGREWAQRVDTTITALVGALCIFALLLLMCTLAYGAILFWKFAQHQKDTSSRAVSTNASAQGSLRHTFHTFFAAVHDPVLGNALYSRDVLVACGPPNEEGVFRRTNQVLATWISHGNGAKKGVDGLGARCQYTGSSEGPVIRLLELHRFVVGERHRSDPPLQIEGWRLSTVAHNDVHEGHPRPGKADDRPFKHDVGAQLPLGRKAHLLQSTLGSRGSAIRITQGEPHLAQLPPKQNQLPYGHQQRQGSNPQAPFGGPVRLSNLSHGRHEISSQNALHICLRKSAFACTSHSDRNGQDTLQTTV